VPLRTHMQIIKVTSRRDQKRFADFANQLYKGNPYYAPSLLMDEMALFDPKNAVYEFSEAEYFLAEKDGKVVGRVGLILNRQANEVWNQQRVRFTRLDFIEDIEVARLLMNTAEEWARAHGMKEVHGPMGFSDMDFEGMLIEGFDELDMFTTIYNHPYYYQYLEELGYIKSVDWIEYQIPVPQERNEKIAKIAEMVMKRSKFRLLEFTSKRKVKKWIPKIFDLISEAYAPLYGVFPIPEALKKQTASKFLTLINLKLVKLMVDENDDLVALAIACPSMTRAMQAGNGRLTPKGLLSILRAINHNDRMDLFFVAIKPELQGRGINAVLLDAVNRDAIEMGIKLAETGPQLETNHKIQSQWKSYSPRLHRRRRCYIKTV